MVLSFCSNWETMDQLSSNMGQFYDPQSELADALIGLYDPIDVPIDSLFDQPPQPPDDPFDYAEPAPVYNLLPSFSDPSIMSLPADIHTQIDEFDVCRCPKRPRSCGDLYQSSELMFEASSHNPSFVAPAMSGWPSVEFSVPLPLPPPPPPQPAGEKKPSGGGCLSAQSIAARERRKRISEKTQELGRLIPGGNKMNTAEMFQAAFKYVKFLQAQVGILSLMGSMQGLLGGEGSAEVAEDLHVLLKSPTIQEKLSVEEKCIVTKEMLDAMVKDSNIRSIPFISRGLHNFAQINGSKSMGR